MWEVGGGLAHGASVKEGERVLERELWRSLLKEAGLFDGAGAGASSGSGWAGMVADTFAEVVADAIATGHGGGVLATARTTAAVPRFTRAARAVGGAARPASQGLASQGLTLQGFGSLGLGTLDNSGRGAKLFADETLLRLVDGPARISSRFGMRRDPISKENAHHHDGVDIAAREGALIRAAADGVVTWAGPRGGYGNLVEITHADGQRTRYAHARELIVRKGEKIRAGRGIARVGHTGRATGPHLHFEVRRPKGAPTSQQSALDPTRALKTYARGDDSGDERRLPEGGPHG